MDSQETSLRRLHQVSLNLRHYSIEKQRNHIAFGRYYQDEMPDTTLSSRLHSGCDGWRFDPRATNRSKLRSPPKRGKLIPAATLDVWHLMPYHVRAFPDPQHRPDLGEQQAAQRRGVSMTREALFALLPTRLTTSSNSRSCNNQLEGCQYLIAVPVGQCRYAVTTPVPNGLAMKVYRLSLCFCERRS